MQDSHSTRGKGKAALAANMHILSEVEFRFASSLIGLGQGHLFGHWPAPGFQDDDKHRFLNQAMHLNEDYPGGLREYIMNARQLLLKSKHGISSNAEFVPEIADGFSVEPRSTEILDFEREGYANMHQCAFVLVAGGLGERLGYSGIKVALPAEITTGRCFLQYYIDNVLALQSICDMSPGQKLPFIIMTSHETHQKTLDLLVRNNYFGADRSQFILVKQGEVPAIVDTGGHLALNSDDNYQLMTKPHGHGDVHRLLYTTGVAKNLVDAGYKWIYFFQDTNVLAFKPLPACLGISAKHNLDVNTMAVPRKAGDACGAIMKLRRPDGTSLINNVEYNEVQDLLGDKMDYDPKLGESPYPGNTNQIIFKLSSYLQALVESNGKVPEFVNPKYENSDKTSFQTPTRLECMMQDFPKVFPEKMKPEISFVKMKRWFSYSPVKNSVAKGVSLASVNLPPMTASTGEADVYICNRELLRIAGVEVQDAAVTVFNGIPIVAGPRVILAPSFAVGVGDVIHKVKGGRISSKSTLIVSGPDVFIEDLDLDGTLIVKAVPGARVKLTGLTVKNKGWALEQLKSGGSRVPPEELRVRGYQLRKYEQRVLEFTEAGDYEVRT
mmetsp:Transcript_42448/g.133715  ORF Transcript_42448/g.133715 Transcript_42448/m.133715 type:complete len:610 (+) Transcript_42448:195-2024(+)